MKRLIVIALILTGCATAPSVCDKINPSESLLCSIAQKQGVNLEQIGTLIMVVNLRAIHSGSYSAKEAVEVLTHIRALAEQKPSASGLKTLLLRYVSDYPELLLVSPYISYLDTPEPIKDKDRDMLVGWIDQQIAMLK